CQPDSGSSVMLGNGFSCADLPDAETSPFLGGSTPDRSKLFGSHGQRPWFHEVMTMVPPAEDSRQLSRVVHPFQQPAGSAPARPRRLYITRCTQRSLRHDFTMR